MLTIYFGIIAPNPNPNTSDAHVYNEGKKKFHTSTIDLQRDGLAIKFFAVAHSVVTNFLLIIPPLSFLTEGGLVHLILFTLR